MGKSNLVLLQSVESVKREENEAEKALKEGLKDMLSNLPKGVGKNNYNNAITGLFIGALKIALALPDIDPSIIDRI